jgi:hypothetical protein
MIAMNNSGAKWTPEQASFIAQNYGAMSVSELAKILGRTRKAVVARRYRCREIPPQARRWSDEEIRELKAAYVGAEYSDDIGIAALAERLGRTYCAIQVKAGKLGITDIGREGKRVKKVKTRAFKTKAELGKHQSTRIKKWHSENLHPRGMLGKHHTDETKETLRLKSTATWAAKKPSEKRKFALNAIQKRIEKSGGGGPKIKRGTWKAGWREIGGQRAYFRSRWEANYARYLQWLKEAGQIQSWEHEPKTFWFDGVRRGAVSYLPDFAVVEKTGETVYHEVKGWMDAASKTKIKRMAKYHPEIKLIVVDGKSYKSILKNVGRMIVGWERGEVVKGGAVVVVVIE